MRITKLLFTRAKVIELVTYLKLGFSNRSVACGDYRLAVAPSTKEREQTDRFQAPLSAWLVEIGRFASVL